MKSAAEIYLEHVESLCGREATSFHKLPPTRPGLGALSCALFEGVPEPGYLTAATLGLSLADHPEWKFGKPELMICVNSTDPAWAMAITDIAEQHRGDFTFSYGQTINFNARISPDSEMSGFFLFAPSFPTRAFQQEETKVVLPATTVHLKGMYPMYDGEIDLYRRLGLERFWKLDGFDPWDVRRPDLSKLYA
ncbi:MAG TPA: suppressor of fused domain protein [Tepidisphaeraceae bacterium]|nr:suppressor of fused domain protein [Tepidisphaeraceae bacterium]